MGWGGSLMRYIYIYVGWVMNYLIFYISVSSRSLLLLWYRLGGSSSPQLRPQGKARADGINNPSNLKILGGIARGRRLDSPDVYLRPMMGKVREVSKCVSI